MTPTSTFAELYCAQNACPPSEFQRTVFWKTLYWHAVPLAPLLLMGDHFAPDHGMIEACGRATRLQQIDEEIDDHRFHPRNEGWLRWFGHLRISNWRLRKLAGLFLPSRIPSRGLEDGAAQPIAARPPAPSQPLAARKIFRAVAL